MSVAAQEAQVLASLLESRRGRDDPLDGLAEAFFTEIQPLLETPWAGAMADLVYPQTRGERPPDFEERLQYARALMRRAAEDHETDKIVFEVRSLPKPQSAPRARTRQPDHVDDGGGVSLRCGCGPKGRAAQGERLTRSWTMLEEVPEVSMAQQDGALPAALGAGSAPGESGVSVWSARFKGAMHISATSRQHHHVFFNLSDRSRYQCHIAGRSLLHEPALGSLAVCPAESDYAADADGTIETVLVAVDPGRLALAAAEDSEIDAQLIDRLSDYDQVLLDFAQTLASESAAGYPNGPLFWNEIASAFIDNLLVRHTTRFDGGTRGILGKDAFRLLRDYIMAHLDEPIEVAALADLAGRSPFHFTRVFTQSVGMSPHRYVVHLRLQRAVELMRDGQSGLAEIAACTGFADQSHLSRWIRRVHGVSPTHIAA